jgi:glycosyltransferase involved in cell wall biosynthesis
MSIWDRYRPSFGFVSTRLSGTDGVSLETEKWAEVFRRNGCDVCFCAGELDTDPAVSYLAPAFSFKDAAIREIQEELFTRKRRTRELTRRIQVLKDELYEHLVAFRDRFRFDVLVVENALAIPVNVPLGLALAEFITETGIPTIAHHHDFFWERQRFHSYAAIDYLRAAFPPLQPQIQHVVINSLGGHELGRRTGVKWTMVPNIMDFRRTPPGIDDYTRDLKREIGLKDTTKLILQPTRLVGRKGIETAIELAGRLEMEDVALVIPHEAGDEGFEYQKRVTDYARYMNVDLRLISDRVAKTRRTDPDGRKRYTLWDIYPHADLVTYPSLYEGYGNAFVEAIYFRRPVLVNRYQIYEADIEPLGFDVIAFSAFITEDTVQRVRTALTDPGSYTDPATRNYEIGARYLSYEMFEEKLELILTNIFGA